ncbi:MAG: transporter substrate-binding domain-containing protein [Clostridiales bacterium]|nr:transporter substrate-binding domain-containing protein [Clostridiales bacterium]
MNKKLIKTVALSLVASMGFLMAGCGQQEAADNELGTVTAGVLTMATNAYFPPYEYYEGDAIVGIDAEIAQAVADKLGLELVIEDVEFDSIIAGVQAGKYDIGCAGMTVTEERLQSVNFTSTYSTGIQSIIVLEGSDITDLDSLIASGCMVGVQSGTTGDLYMTDDLGEDRIDRYNKANDAVMALLNGVVGAVVIDNQPAQSFVSANEGLVILETPYTIEDYAMAVNKDNQALLEAINNALAELEADGTIQAIIDSYIPPEGA